MTTINVTQQHIDAGQAQHACLCPVALAINNLLVDPYWIWVSKGYATIFQNKDGQHLAHMMLPVEARKSIRELDNIGRTQPFTFDLDLPPQFLKGE